MARSVFNQRLARLQAEHDALLSRPNQPVDEAGNGIYERWCHPVVTRDHAPLAWRYDLSPVTNPHLLERIGVNSAFNAGAIRWQGRYLLVLRMESVDRKSWFAIAESDNGIDGFRFHERPVDIPAADDLETNLYDMRLTAHEDGWIYGLFCTERHDPAQPDDPTAAIARCGIARTHDLVNWKRLPDLVTRSPQQRNVVLHPAFIDGRYGLYTRPQDGFIDAGGAGGLSWGLAECMENANIGEEVVVDERAYHTIAEAKNGQGPPPIRTGEGWLHLAHGVRGTAAGLRYVLYPFLTELERPWVIRRKPGGHLIAPRGDERTGDVSNVVFCNGWIRDGDADDARVLIYYASADTRMHVATSSVDRLVDHCLNAPADGQTTAGTTAAIQALVTHNQKWSET